MFTGPRRTRADAAEGDGNDDDDDDRGGKDDTDAADGKRGVAPRTRTRTRTPPPPPRRRRFVLPTPTPTSAPRPPSPPRPPPPSSVSGSSDAMDTSTAPTTRWGSAGAPPPPRPAVPSVTVTFHDFHYTSDALFNAAFPRHMYWSGAFEPHWGLRVVSDTLSRDRVLVWRSLASNETEIGAIWLGPENRKVDLDYTTALGASLTFVVKNTNRSSAVTYTRYVAIADLLRPGFDVPHITPEEASKPIMWADVPTVISACDSAALTRGLILFKHGDYPRTPFDPGAAGPFLRLAAAHGAARAVRDPLEDAVLDAMAKKGIDLRFGGFAPQIDLMDVSFVSGSSDIACILRARWTGRDTLSRLFIIRIGTSPSDPLRWTHFQITQLDDPTSRAHVGDPLSHIQWRTLYTHFPDATIWVSQQRGQRTELYVYSRSGVRIQTIQLPTQEMVIGQHHAVVGSASRGDILKLDWGAWAGSARRVTANLRLRIRGPEQERATAAAAAATAARPTHLDRELHASGGQLRIYDTLVDVMLYKHIIFANSAIVSLIASFAGELITDISRSERIIPDHAHSVLTDLWLPLATLPDGAMLMSSTDREWSRYIFRLRRISDTSFTIAVDRLAWSHQNRGDTYCAVIARNELRASYTLTSDAGWKMIESFDLASLFVPKPSVVTSLLSLQSANPSVDVFLPARAPLQVVRRRPMPYAARWTLDGKLAAMDAPTETIALRLERTMDDQPLYAPAVAWWDRLLAALRTVGSRTGINAKQYDVVYAELVAAMPPDVSLPPAQETGGLFARKIDWVCGTRDAVINLIIDGKTLAEGDRIRLVIRIPELDPTREGRAVPVMTSASAAATSPQWSTYFVGRFGSDMAHVVICVDHAVFCVTPDGELVFYSYSGRELHRLARSIPLQSRHGGYRPVVICFPASRTQLAVLIGETAFDAQAHCSIYGLYRVTLRPPFTNSVHALRN